MRFGRSPYGGNVRIVVSSVPAWWRGFTFILYSLERWREVLKLLARDVSDEEQVTVLVRLVPLAVGAVLWSVFEIVSEDTELPLDTVQEFALDLGNRFLRLLGVQNPTRFTQHVQPRKVYHRTRSGAGHHTGPKRQSTR